MMGKKREWLFFLYMQAPAITYLYILYNIVLTVATLSASKMWIDAKHVDVTM